MLTCTARYIDPVNHWAAGYVRATSNHFVPLVTGCPSESAALHEAERLNAAARSRQVAASVEHHLRAPSAAWYVDE